MEWVVFTTTWYVLLVLLGAIFFPMTRRLLHPLYDQGYAFSKTVALILITYTIFALGSAHILPFTFWALIGIITVYAMWNYALVKGQKKVQKLPIRTLVFEEILFCIAFYSWAYVRSREPSLHGLEKFMDYGFMQSVLRTTYFPAADMWLAGKGINYYYFGHISGAVLTRLSTLPPQVTYNLILAQIFALGITQTFALGLSLAYTGLKKNLKLAYIGGIMSSFIVNLGGNLHTIYAFTTGYGEHPAPLWTLKAKYPWSAVFHPIQAMKILADYYWYPNATRFIPFTIHEFPLYSYVVADLHGHVFAIPFVLFTLALLFSLFTLAQSPKPFQLIGKSFKQIQHLLVQDLSLTKGYLTYVLVLGAMISIHLMTNAFDAPIYLLLSGCIILGLFGFSQRTFFYGGVMLATFFIVNIPFSHAFEPFATGVGFNCVPPALTHYMKSTLGVSKHLIFEGNCQSSPWWMLLTLWGFFLFNFVFMIGYFFKKQFKVERTTTLMLILFAYGCLLILVPEFIYAKDIYPTHFRANTMFKLGYQAFIMMGLASGYTFVLFKSHIKSFLSKFYIVLFVPLFLLIAIYPQFAVQSYYGTDARPMSLDGSTWINTTYAEYAEIIDYLQKNVSGQPFILEAQGDSYTDFDVVSAYTGLPTVAGWWVHEWLWRGDAQVVGQLIPDIEQIYSSPDLVKTRQLLSKYNVKYVIIGTNEKKKYPSLQISKFEALGKAIFTSQNGSGIIYEIPIDSL